MKWELDDNARSGFHYLVLGAALIALLACINYGIDLVFPGIGPDGAFSHGYLIEDTGENLVGANTSRAERLAASLLVAGLAAVSVAAAVYGVGRALGRRPISAALFMLRCVFLGALIYCIHGALFCPPVQFVGFRDGHIIRWRRSTHLFDLPWPMSKKTDLIPFEQVVGVSAIVEPEVGRRCAPVVVLTMKRAEREMLGNGRAGTCGDDTMMRFAKQRAASINATIFGQ